MVMRRRRVTEARVAELAAVLSQRDLDVVATLDRVRVATGAQLRRLHFTTGTAAANARQAQRRLRQFVELRVLAELARRVGGPSGGSAQSVYALDVAGQRLASACGPAGGARLRRPWTPGSTFIAHALAVTELFVRLTEHVQAGGGELVAFDAEPACWRAFTGLGGGRSWLKPDAFVHFAAGDLEHLTFLEVDRATQSPAAVNRKLRSYRQFFQTGREQRRWGVFPRTVILVPTQQRQRALAEVVAAQPPESRPLFAVVAYDLALPTLTGER
jgi:hypothetical protein